MSDRLPRPLATACLLAALSFLLYLSNGPALPGNDAKASTYLPLSFLYDGDLYFTPSEAPFLFVWEIDLGDGRRPLQFRSWSDRLGASGPSAAELYITGKAIYSTPYYILPVPGRTAKSGERLFASAFGPAAGLVALPAAFVAQGVGLNLAGDHSIVWGAAKVTAALLIAGSVAFFYLTAVAFTTPVRAALLAGAYAAGTCVWSLSSQTLWQQTPSIFFLSLGILCLVRGRRSWTTGAAAGLAFSAAAVCRPTAALVLVAVAIHLVLLDRRSFPTFLLAAVPLPLLMAWYSAYTFGTPVAFAQLDVGAQLAQVKTGSSDVWQTPLWLGAAGLLLSPSRGLLIHSPFLLAAFAGAVLAWTRPEFVRLRFLTLAVAALWLPAFKWFD